MNSSIQFRTMAKSFWKLPLDLKKEKRERETPFNLARPSFLRGPYEIFHPIQNSFAWIPEAFISTPPSGAPVPFNKNRGKQRTALKRGEGEAWKKRGGGFFLLAKERVGREEWMAEREKIESHTGKRRNYIARASMYNLPWRKGEMEAWQGCRAYFRGWVRRKRGDLHAAYSYLPPPPETASVEATLASLPFFFPPFPLFLLFVKWRVYMRLEN